MCAVGKTFSQLLNIARRRSSVKCAANEQDGNLRFHFTAESRSEIRAAPRFAGFGKRKKVNDAAEQGFLFFTSYSRQPFGGSTGSTVNDVFLL